MRKPYRLYWVRHNGCDSGTAASVEDLDAAIRERVAALTMDSDETVPLHLPFLDAREWRGRSHVLRTLLFARDAEGIHGVWPSRLAPLRDKAAWLKALDPAWREAVREKEAGYSRTWQRVSIGLQTSLRRWIREIYFADPTRYENRDVAYSVLVYSVSRPFPGRRKTEFTFDVANEETLPAALRMIGCATQSALAAAEAQLNACGDKELAHRYAPVWYQDVINAVWRKPARLVSLLGDEGMLINAIIQLGTRQAGGFADLSGVKPFARSASLAMRSILGVDMRPLAIRALEETTNLLREANQAVKRKPARPSATLRSQPGALHLPSSEPGTSGRYMLGSAASR